MTHSSSKRIQVTPLDPLMLRDGKPFGDVAGIRAHTVNDVLSNTFAGSIRTMLHKALQQQVKLNPYDLQESELKQQFEYIWHLDIRGPLYRYKGKLYFPTPKDAEIVKKAKDDKNHPGASVSTDDSKHDPHVQNSKSAQPSFAINDSLPSNSVTVEKADQAIEVRRIVPIEHTLANYNSDQAVADDPAHILTPSSATVVFGGPHYGRKYIPDRLWLPENLDVRASKHNVAPAYISEDLMKDWLIAETDVHADFQQKVQILASSSLQANRSDDLEGAVSVEQAPLYLSAFEKEERVHIQMVPGQKMVAEGKLFSTRSLVLPLGLTLEAQIDEHKRGEYPKLNDWKKGFSRLHTLGGERRLVQTDILPDESESAPTALTTAGAASANFWDFPPEIGAALDGKQYVRMVLATPAFFKRGWLPGWLDEQLMSKSKASNSEHNVSDEDRQGIQLGDCQLQLVWATIPRWQAVSGWAKHKPEPQTSDSSQPQTKIAQPRYSERMVRRMVPAGSVYFFKVISGNPAELARLNWLRSVSDANPRHEAHDRGDGFGLALWGAWKPETTSEPE
ncbi:type III-B CRISPR module-associated Cmr3 family protein [Paenibacillus campi]|uniref:type III-B CRISPR module-associated Cmr3 family protein n=1 Tax=Paenibacillus campi TaxID=3106031 RepID=UPI002AFFFDF3|nr:type III-B CRISPR module-associated Cmr3 family protein [Paenibacillus sp. SGZ-1014]